MSLSASKSSCSRRPPDVRTPSTQPRASSPTPASKRLSSTTARNTSDAGSESPPPLKRKIALDTATATATAPMRPARPLRPFWVGARGGAGGAGRSRNLTRGSLPQLGQRAAPTGTSSVQCVHRIVDGRPARRVAGRACCCASFDDPIAGDRPGLLGATIGGIRPHGGGVGGPRRFIRRRVDTASQPLAGPDEELFAARGFDRPSSSSGLHGGVAATLAPAALRPDMSSSSSPSTAARPTGANGPEVASGMTGQPNIDRAPATKPSLAL